MKKNYCQPEILIVNLTGPALLFDPSNGDGGGSKGDLGATDEVLSRRGTFWGDDDE